MSTTTGKRIDMAPTSDGDSSGALGPAVWIVSLVVHGFLFYLLATSAGDWLAPPGTDVGRSGTEAFHRVGVVVEAGTEAPVEHPNPDGHEAAQPHENQRDPAFRQVGSPETEVPAQAPAPLELPSRDSEGIGAGNLQPARSGMPLDVHDLVRDGGIGGSPGALGGLEAGETRFFGIRDKGARIVYVIDRSGSMGGAKLNAARTQLLASLQTLLPKQQFQVLLYDHNVLPMQLGTSDGRGSYPATDINKTKTRQYLGSIATDGGTNRELALTTALSYEPDVVYFLTDGDAVELDRVRRNRIAQRNDERAGARIHCIEFGEGAAPSVRNALGRLAYENGGVYRYVRVGTLAP